MADYAWDKSLWPDPAAQPPEHGLLGPIQLEQLASLGFCTIDPPHVRIAIAALGDDGRAAFFAAFPFLPKDMHIREYPPLGNRADTIGQQCLMARSVFVPTGLFIRPPMPGEPL
jgi:hypothetical protein